MARTKSRVYCLSDAERLLPYLGLIVTDIRTLAVECRNTIRQRRAFQREGPAQLVELYREREDGYLASARAAMLEIESLACRLHDLDPGIVDIPTRHQKKPAWFCWSPEDGPKLRWFHSLTGDTDERQELPPH